MPIFIAIGVVLVQIVPTYQVLLPLCFVLSHVMTAVLIGDEVTMDLCRLRLGEDDMSVDALRVALMQLEAGMLSRQVSIRSIRLGT
jgi:hypothetical protein